MQGDGSGPPSRHVLVVERDMITGLGLSEDLIDLGYRVSGPLAGPKELLALIETDPPDAAIIDLACTDGSGIMAARALRAREVPVVFFSAGDRRHYARGEFAEVPWVDKPATTDRLLGALKLPHGRSYRLPSDPNSDS
jgi:DNA-binding response OmpR family regulator